MEFSLPRDIEGGYRLLRKIGEGGMGVVYEGIHLVLERPVAIKMILPSSENGEEAETVARRFLREAKTIAKIQSDHVVDISHFGQTKHGELFLVMEFIKGCSLAQYLRHCKKLSAEITCHIGAQVASGLTAAHDEGVIHRDLKAANVMLTQKGADKLFAKVLDFGVAKLADDSDKTLTQAGLMVGTLSTMSPEQITGAPVDHRSDIYSMGVLLYRMLSGLRLFEVTDVAGISYHHVHVKPKPFEERVEGIQIPKALGEIIFRCLEKKPDDRYQKMSDVVAALKDVFAEQQFDMVTDAGNYLAEPTNTRSDQPTRTIMAVDPNSLVSAAKPSATNPRMSADYISESLAQTLTGMDEKPAVDDTMLTQQGVSLNSSHLASGATRVAPQQAAWLKPVVVGVALLLVASVTWFALDKNQANQAPQTPQKPTQVIDAQPLPPATTPPPKTPPPQAPTPASVEATQPKQVQEPKPDPTPKSALQAPAPVEEVQAAPKPTPPTKRTPTRSSKRKSSANKGSKSSSSGGGFIRTTPKKKSNGFIRTSPKKEEGSGAFRRVQTR